MARFTPRGSIVVPGCQATIQVRQAAHRLGYRFRLHVTGMPGSPHIVFPKHQALLFVCSCTFMAHGCDRTRSYWAEPPSWARHAGEKAEAVVEALRNQGWRANILWECEVDEGDLAARLALLIKG